MPTVNKHCSMVSNNAIRQEKKVEIFFKIYIILGSLIIYPENQESQLKKYWN